METLKKYKGTSNYYTEIAVRGDNEILGLHIEYQLHPITLAGHLVTRFVAITTGFELGKFKHFSPRESTTFLLPPNEEKSYLGARLNRVAIPLFGPGVHRGDVRRLGDEMGLWGMVASWVQEQAQADGFSIHLESLPDAIQDFFPVKPVKEPKLILSFPELQKTSE